MPRPTDEALIAAARKVAKADSGMRTSKKWAELVRQWQEHRITALAALRELFYDTDRERVVMALMRIADPDDACHGRTAGPWQDVAQQALGFTVTDPGDWYENGRKLSVPEMIAKAKDRDHA
jgi:hypothetical protein